MFGFQTIWEVPTWNYSFEIYLSMYNFVLTKKQIQKQIAYLSCGYYNSNNNNMLVGIFWICTCCKKYSLKDDCIKQIILAYNNNVGVAMFVFPLAK